MIDEQWHYLRALEDGPAAVSASERGSMWWGELAASGWIETFHAGPLPGIDAEGVMLLCARLTPLGRRRLAVGQGGSVWTPARLTPPPQPDRE